jgi:hypothetical protein
LPKGSSRADYRKALEDVRKVGAEVAVHPPEEVCSREVMRTAGRQPRILLTNVKQLELLLTRHVDVELFDNALLDFLVFDEAGKVQERVALKAGGPVQAIEIPVDTWHSIASLESGTIFLEVKQGPYSAPKGGNCAAWAPTEDEKETGLFEAWYRSARPGDEPPEIS